MSEQRLHTHWQQKVFAKLLGLQYKLVYKKGTENRVVDALSRKSSHDSECSAVTACSPKWIQEVLNGYHQDPHASSILTKLLLDEQAVPNFSIHQGLLKYKGRVWVGDNFPLQ